MCRTSLGEELQRKVENWEEKQAYKEKKLSKNTDDKEVVVAVLKEAGVPEIAIC